MPGDERQDLAAMVMRLGRHLIKVEEPILERHGVSMWAYIVLSTLRERPTRTQAALAASINADKTRLIPVLDQLQDRGLIDREPDPADRRVRLLSLTPAGESLQQAIQADIRAAEDSLLANLSAERSRIFLSALRTLSEIPASPNELN